MLVGRGDDLLQRHVIALPSIAALSSRQRGKFDDIGQHPGSARTVLVGYHPTKGLFSRLDRGMLLYLTDEQMAEWGHWFFRTGGEDQTALMRTIDRGEGDWRTAAVSDADAFAVLHEQVRPRLMSSLCDGERLQKRCLMLLQDGMRLITKLQADTRGNLPRGRLRKMLIGGYILVHEEADRVLEGRPGSVLVRLAPYEAYFEAQIRLVKGLSDRDALLRWELEHIGNPLAPIVNQPWFSGELRSEISKRLPVLRRFMAEQV